MLMGEGNDELTPEWRPLFTRGVPAQSMKGPALDRCVADLSGWKSAVLNTLLCYLNMSH